MKDEIRIAIRKMKSGKATGLDNTKLKLSEALGNNEVDEIANLWHM